MNQQLPNFTIGKMAGDIVFFRHKMTLEIQFGKSHES